VKYITPKKMRQGQGISLNVEYLHPEKFLVATLIVAFLDSWTTHKKADIC
jgi:hypothetical protein